MIETQKEIPNLVSALSMLESNGITGYKKNQAMKNFLQTKARETDTPLSGSFELTPYCNFDCKMCYVHLPKNKMGFSKELDTSQWIELIDKAVEHGMLYATLTGGECLIYNGFREIYTHLMDKGVFVTILTNGYLLDREKVDWLADKPPSSVQITVYGSNNDIYEKVTGVRAFDIICQAISLIQNAGIMLRLAITPNAYMLDDFENLYRFVRETHAEYGVNSTLIPARKETGLKYEDFNISVEDYVNILMKRAKYDGKKIQPVCDEYEDYIIDNKSKQCKNTSDFVDKAKIGLDCSAGRCSFQLSWDGKMHPCTNLTTIEADTLKSGFYPAWLQINQKAKEYRYPIECSSCSLREKCQSCPAEHEFNSESGYCNTDVCERTKRMIAAGLII